jgi:hypothetical protein
MDGLVSSYLYICQPTLLVSKVVKWSLKNEDRILFLERKKVNNLWVIGAELQMNNLGLYKKKFVLVYLV